MKDAEPKVCVAVEEIQASDKTANSLVGIGDATAVDVAAGAQGFEEHGGDALDVARGRELWLPGFPRDFGIANEFVQANGYGLPQIHRDIFFAGGNAHQPVAVAEGFV